MLSSRIAFAILLLVVPTQGTSLHLAGKSAEDVNRCASEDSCGINACCLVGFQRYSIPKCAPLGDEGDHCRIGDQPQYMELAYPNDAKVTITAGFVGFCPCKEHLYCSPATSSCHPKAK